jgi:putative Holliday junction resolvase
MGIDFGTKRVGVAFSNEGGTMAFPHDVLKNDESLLKSFIALAKEHKVDAIVIGHSIGRNGIPNKVQKAIDELIGDLTLELAVPIHLEPEQYTTQEALRIQGKNEKTDASAASLILNSYLTKLKSL